MGNKKDLLKELENIGKAFTLRHAEKTKIKAYIEYDDDFLLEKLILIPEEKSKPSTDYVKKLYEEGKNKEVFFVKVGDIDYYLKSDINIKKEDSFCGVGVPKNGKLYFYPFEYRFFVIKKIVQER